VEFSYACSVLLLGSDASSVASFAELFEFSQASRIAAYAMAESGRWFACPEETASSVRYQVFANRQKVEVPPFCRPVLASATGTVRNSAGNGGVAHRSRPPPRPSPVRPGEKSDGGCKQTSTAQFAPALSPVAVSPTKASPARI